jgi:LPS O-antigen subunit length determinant protein (WzzB/FepE family)
MVIKKKSLYSNDNIMDLSNIIKTLWKEKIFIFSISLMFMVVGYIYSSFQPKIYQTEISYADVNKLNLLPDIYQINNFEKKSNLALEGTPLFDNNIIKSFNEILQFELLSSKSLAEFVENNNEINIFKTQPKKIIYKSYSKNLVTLKKKEQKYILTFSPPIQGEKFLEDYVSFINKRLEIKTKKYLEDSLLTSINHKENILKSLEKINLDNLDQNSKYEHRVQISLVLNDILLLTTLIDKVKKYQFMFNIGSASTPILISKPLEVYLVSSFLFGFLFSSLIIFSKKYII